MYNSKTWAYDLPSHELVERLSDAAARTGISNSGLVIALGRAYHRTGFTYLRGVVMSRMEQKRPPFKLGAEFQLREGLRTSRSKNHDGDLQYCTAESGTVYELCQLWYLPKSFKSPEWGWQLEFGSLPNWLFAADDFSKLGEEVETV